MLRGREQQGQGVLVGQGDTGRVHRGAPEILRAPQGSYPEEAQGRGREEPVDVPLREGRRRQDDNRLEQEKSRRRGAAGQNRQDHKAERVV